MIRLLIVLAILGSLIAYNEVKAGEGEQVVLPIVQGWNLFIWDGCENLDLESDAFTSRVFTIVSDWQVVTQDWSLYDPNLVFTALQGFTELEVDHPYWAHAIDTDPLTNTGDVITLWFQRTDSCIGGN
jgi:hypothetical protein